jgi:NAD(P)-dependent dehydrogenase (short-subunit alcohol dehydrogenase family)
MIVNTASTAGLLEAPRMGAYAAAKYGVIRITQTAAIEYAQKNIRINAICRRLIGHPQCSKWMKDEQVRKSLLSTEPLGRAGRPEEIGNAVAWLFFDAA